MSKIEFSKGEKEVIAQKLQTYMKSELDQEIGQFDAEFLLDFISEELGSYYYNRGLSDARTALESRVADLTDAIYELEEPTEFVR